MVAKYDLLYYNNKNINNSNSIGRSAIVFYSQVQRFDIDNDSGVCHAKCKTYKEYEEWSLALRKHRLYRLGNVWSHEESIEDLQKKVLHARSNSNQNNTLSNWIVNSDYFIKVHYNLEAG